MGCDADLLREHGCGRGTRGPASPPRRPAHILKMAADWQAEAAARTSGCKAQRATAHCPVHTQSLAALRSEVGREVEAGWVAACERSPRTRGRCLLCCGGLRDLVPKRVPEPSRSDTACRDFSSRPPDRLHHAERRDKPPPSLGQGLSQPGKARQHPAPPAALAETNARSPTPLSQTTHTASQTSNSPQQARTASETMLYKCFGAKLRKSFLKELKGNRDQEERNSTRAKETRDQ